MLVALIMAGGSGTRFWPISTEKKPKQFLNLIDERTMIQATVERLEPLIDINHIFVCTGQQYVGLVKKQLPNLPKKNIIVEPIARNTAPCILLSILYIRQIYKECKVVVLPSDHKINDEKEYLSVLSSGNQFLDKYKESIVTIGVTPDRAETGYGYIKYGEVVSVINNHNIEKVNRFVEKPNLDKALEYLDSGHYLWNAGMFMFDVNFMINEFKKHYSSYKLLSLLPSIDDNCYYEKLKKIYENCEAISIDYAIMEKSKKIYVISASFGWDDIGSWKALERYISKDKYGNILKGNVKICNSKNSIIYGNNKEILLIDIDDIFCIDTDDRIILGKKNSLSKVHKLRGR